MNKIFAATVVLEAVGVGYLAYLVGALFGWWA